MADHRDPQHAAGDIGRRPLRSLESVPPECVGRDFSPAYVPQYVGRGFSPAYVPQYVGRDFSLAYVPRYVGRGFSPAYVPQYVAVGLQPRIRPAVRGAGLQPRILPAVRGGGALAPHTWPPPAEIVKLSELMVARRVTDPRSGAYSGFRWRGSTASAGS